jgi:hypothetical protein
MTSLRKALAITLAAFGALMGYVAMTVPVIAATAQALLTIALAVAAYVAWPKHKDVAQRVEPQ